MSPLLEIKDVAKRFGALVAVDGISFTADRGEVVGFLGPNGAGKSTTMRMITGFLAADAGSIKVKGRDIAEDPIGVKAQIGYLPEGAPLYADMTPLELLRFVARVRRMAATRAKDRIDWVVARLDLHGVLNQPIETLSKGFKRRVGLAQAILHDPELLILDEPTDGLDPNQKHEVRGLIRDMARDKAIIISTHILEEVDAVCSRALIISRGRVVVDGTPEQLAARSRHHNAVAMTLRGATVEAIRKTFATMPIIAEVSVAAGGDGLAECVLFPRNGQVIIGEVSRHLRTTGWEIDSLKVEVGHLDDVFRTATTAPKHKPA